MIGCDERLILRQSDSPLQRVQAVVKVPLHSTAAVSRLTSLFLSQILPVFSLVTPCQSAAASLKTGLGATRDFHRGLLH